VKVQLVGRRTQLAEPGSVPDLGGRLGQISRWSPVVSADRARGVVWSVLDTTSASRVHYVHCGQSVNHSDCDTPSSLRTEGDTAHGEGSLTSGRRPAADYATAL
jgi:hypothetical protein